MSEAVRLAGPILTGPPQRGDNAGKHAQAPSVFDSLLERGGPKSGGEGLSPPGRDRLDWSWGGLRGSGQEASAAEPEAGTAGLIAGHGDETGKASLPGELPELAFEQLDGEAFPNTAMIRTDSPDDGEDSSLRAVQGGEGTRKTDDEPGARPKPEPAALDVPRADAANGNGKPGEALVGKQRPAGIPVLPGTAARQAQEAISRAGRGAGAANGQTPHFAQSAAATEGKPELGRLPDIAALRDAGQGGRQSQGGRNDRFETSWQAIVDRNESGGRARPMAGPVTLMSSQTMQPIPPTPAATQLLPGGAAAQVVSAIREDSDPAWRTTAAANQVQEALATRPKPLHSIQIQLNPAELGRVTARLSLAGAQLRVELQVETNKARSQLANDSDAILKALKASGYEIDRVTIQQAPQTISTGTPAGADRGSANLSAQGEQADETAGDGRHGAAEGGNGQGEHSGNDGPHQETARGGIYI